MFQQSIRTAMIKATQDSSQPVGHCRRHLLEIIVAFGSELNLSFYYLMQIKERTRHVLQILAIDLCGKIFIFSPIKK